MVEVIASDKNERTIELWSHRVLGKISSVDCGNDCVVCGSEKLMKKFIDDADSELIKNLFINICDRWVEYITK